MRSQTIIAALAFAISAAPAFAVPVGGFPPPPTIPGAPVGEFGGGPTTESHDRNYSGYGMGYEPGQATATWCQEMAASGHVRSHAYATWCVQPRTHG